MRKALILALALPLLAAPAAGQALKGHNSNADVFFEADTIEVQDKADRAIISGNVRVRQAGLSLNADKLTVFYANSISSGVEIQQLYATGRVLITQPDETARGDVAIYDLTGGLITLVGRVTLTQRGNQISGERLVINLKTGRAVINGRNTGTPESQVGRVSGKFTVSKSQ